MTLSAADSVALLAAAQNDQGAIPASSGHDIYRYGWLRDGSWCAYALDRGGQAHAAAAWHGWVARTLLAYEHRVDEAVVAAQTGSVDGRVMMPARFTLDGRGELAGNGEDEWPNFQTDCYGFWLWALADHVGRGGEFGDTLAAAAALAVRYLLAAGHLPCYDCWEEHPGHVHTSSLGAVAAGLRAAARLLEDAQARQRASELAAITTGPEHTLAGSFIRFRGDSRVDGSLLWLAVPFGIVSPTSSIYRNTLTRIRDELLVPGGGVRRYLGDTFYGGSEWILLAAAYGWSSLTLGDRASAEAMLAWIEANADANGHLPEHVQDHVQSPYMRNYWRRRWGNTATPLLWSHAMHAILAAELA